jgi:integrase
VSRVIGPVRKPSTREGLTRSMAEARLRELMSETAKAPPPVTDRLTVEQVGTRLIKHLQAKGRKHSTLESYDSYVRVHLSPYFGDAPIADITSDDVEDFIEPCITERHQAIKSTLNYLGFLHSIFDFAIRKRWTHENPCRLVEKPDPDDDLKDIRFLDQSELEALTHPTNGPSRHNRETHGRAARVRALRDGDELSWKKIASEMGVAESTAIYLYRCGPEAISAADEAFWRVDRVLYLTAAMTGLRQGELLALRWIDVDWLARKIRVRRNYVRGKFGTPKSKRSSRSVPMADLVASELEQLFQASAFQADEDLVFCHPQTGKPLAIVSLPSSASSTSRRAWAPRLDARRGRPDTMHRRRHATGDLPELISCSSVSKSNNSPIGRSALRAAGERAAHSDEYRAARDEYARIRELRKTNPIAAHLRERRFELGLTQQEVATAAGTSHTAISRLESGTHTPGLATLQKIAAVLDEELLLCFQRTVDGEIERDFAGVA